ncbi:hypothetical protein YDYSG_51910 [Paenibacillus tyrfis]|nr:hypothetical protein YDYSG_51910 [Paenibacillus tyrfis]
MEAYSDYFPGTPYLPVNLIRISGIFTGFKGGRKLLRDIPHLYFSEIFYSRVSQQSETGSAAGTFFMNPSCDLNQTFMQPVSEGDMIKLKDRQYEGGTHHVQ